MTIRKPISPKVRFEVFKRDRFTCRYCGRTTPQVILEIDHIVPVAEGGTNEVENLVTACYECNRGKGTVPLDEIPEADENLHERTILLAEREVQLREYNEVMRQIRERQEREAVELIDYWCELTGIDKQRASDFYVPDYIKMLTFLQDIAAEDIKWAMIRATSDTRMTVHQSLKYLYGVLWRWKRDGVDKRERG